MRPRPSPPPRSFTTSIHAAGKGPSRMRPPHAKCLCTQQDLMLRVQSKLEGIRARAAQPRTCAALASGSCVMLTSVCVRARACPAISFTSVCAARLKDIRVPSAHLVACNGVSRRIAPYRRRRSIVGPTLLFVRAAAACAAASPLYVWPPGIV